MRAKVRDLNDAFRTTFRGGRVCMSSRITSLPDDISTEIIEKVRTFSDFNEDNDPYGEHDFGAVNVARQRVFWKIDYYDAAMGVRLGRSGEPGRDDPSAHDLFCG